MSLTDLLDTERLLGRKSIKYAGTGKTTAMIHLITGPTFQSILYQYIGVSRRELNPTTLNDEEVGAQIKKREKNENVE